jgi:ribosomal protein S18 acetylase RimI-like enzyme
MGFGKALYIQTILDAMDKGLKEIATNISVNNLSALNLYSKLNFSFREPKYFLHYWS